MADAQESKTIYGQAWISGKSLVQDQTMVISGVDSVTSTVTLIDDIWETLKKSGIPWKGDESANSAESKAYYFDNKKKSYFFFAYKMTSLDDDDRVITIKLDCPRPFEGMFDEMMDTLPGLYDEYDEEKVEGEYSKYWVSKLKTAAEKPIIQVKEISFNDNNKTSAGSGKEFSTAYTDLSSDGSLIEPKSYTEINNDLGDIENLLGMF